jgi:hypothetical protein
MKERVPCRRGRPKEYPGQLVNTYDPRTRQRFRVYYIPDNVANSRHQGSQALADAAAGALAGAEGGTAAAAVEQVISSADGPADPPNTPPAVPSPSAYVGPSTSPVVPYGDTSPSASEYARCTQVMLGLDNKPPVPVTSDGEEALYIFPGTDRRGDYSFLEPLYTGLRLVKCSGDETVLAHWCTCSADQFLQKSLFSYPSALAQCTKDELLDHCKTCVHVKALEVGLVAAFGKPSHKPGQLSILKA